MQRRRAYYMGYPKRPGDSRRRRNPQLEGFSRFQVTPEILGGVEVGKRMIFVVHREEE
jgi:hypothetical protein